MNSGGLSQSSGKFQIPRPSTHAVLLSGILRSLWNHDAKDNQSSLQFYTPDPTLLRSIYLSLAPPPATSSSVVTAWLQELAHHYSLPHTGYDHIALPKKYSPSLPVALWACISLRGPRGHRHLIPLQFSIGTDTVPIPFRSFSHVSIPLENCLPVGLIRDTWIWRDIFTGTSVLVPLES